MDKKPKYLTSAQFAQLHGLSQIAVRKKCARGNVPGAFKLGEGEHATWCIPEDAKYEDGRIKSGKYIGAQRARKKTEANEESPE